MEAHPAIPHAKQLPTDHALARKVGESRRNAGIAAGVECGISKAAAKDHSERAIEEQVVRMTLRHGGAGGLDRL